MSSSNADTDDDTITICASCGKEGNSDDMNTCNTCKSVKYCNAACKKKHRKKHKKACERRVAELHEEALFNDVERDECPICMLPMPIHADQITYKSCCGKTICDGCIYAMDVSEGKDLCPFCRIPPPSSDEDQIKRVKKLMDNGNAGAFHQLAGYYARGINGMPQDHQKSNELLIKAGELGYSEAYHHLGHSYDNGYGVEVDIEKAKYYYELAAMNGSIKARHNLGCTEGAAGDEQRAYKHCILAARAGYESSLDAVEQGFMHGDVTKDEYEDTLHAYQKSVDEMKSDERDKAAAVVVVQAD